MTKEQYIYFLIDAGFEDLQLNFFLYDLFYGAKSITEDKIDEIYEAYRVYSLKVGGDSHNVYSDLVRFLRDLRMHSYRYGDQSYIIVLNGSLNPYYLNKYGIPMVKNFLINPSVSFFKYISRIVNSAMLNKEWAYNMLVVLDENAVLSHELSLSGLSLTKVDENKVKKMSFVDGFDAYRIIKHEQEVAQMKNNLQNTKLQGSNVNRSEVMYY